MKIIKAFKCEYCRRGRPYASKSSCKDHEAKCFENPETKSCATCRFKETRHDYIKFGCYRVFWVCTAKKLQSPLTTNCRSWKQQEEAQ